MSEFGRLSEGAGVLMNLGWRTLLRHRCRRRAAPLLISAEK
jgi:hypothetical protein